MCVPSRFLLVALFSQIFDQGRDDQDDDQQTDTHPKPAEAHSPTHTITVHHRVLLVCVAVAPDIWPMSNRNGLCCGQFLIVLRRSIGNFSGFPAPFRSLVLSVYHALAAPAVALPAHAVFQSRQTLMTSSVIMPVARCGMW